MLRIIKILKSNKGSALAMVLILLSLLSILSISALYIAMSNTAQVRSQNNNLRAYYIAYSGIEAGYAALFTDTSTKDLLGEFKSGKLTSLGPEEILIGNNGDKAEVSVNITESGKTILITSKGTINQGEISKTIQMSFPVNYPELRKWIEK